MGTPNGPKSPYRAYPALRRHLGVGSWRRATAAVSRPAGIVVVQRPRGAKGAMVKSRNYPEPGSRLAANAFRGYEKPCDEMTVTEPRRIESLSENQKLDII